MKQINVISPVYKNQKVNFNGFIVDFNIEGKGVLKFEEGQAEAVSEVLNTHPNIYKGDKLPVQEKIEAPVNKEEKVEQNNQEIELLKESNKNLALENASLKKENEQLKKEKQELENKIVELEKEPTKEENNEGEGTEEGAGENVEGEGSQINEEGAGAEGEGTEGEGTKESEGEGEGEGEKSLREQLESKTVSQLKEILNSEDFIKFKEEWKSLTKKDDIINYLIKKAEE